MLVVIICEDSWIIRFLFGLKNGYILNFKILFFFYLFIISLFIYFDEFSDIFIYKM